MQRRSVSVTAVSPFSQQCVSLADLFLTPAVDNSLIVSRASQLQHSSLRRSRLYRLAATGSAYLYIYIFCCSRIGVSNTPSLMQVGAYTYLAKWSPSDLQKPTDRQVMLGTALKTHLTIINRCHRVSVYFGPAGTRAKSRTGLMLFT